MQDILRDLQFAWRQLRKNPGFTWVAILSLALGIGANTALFSVVYGVLISPYPYARPETMWTPQVKGLQPNQGRTFYPLPQYRQLAQSPVFAETMATSPGRVLLTGQFAPETLTGVFLTDGAFRFLGVAPVLGRTFGPADIQPGGEPEHVTVLSYRLWQRLFAGDSSALGKSLRINDESYTVIGVMPPRFGWYTSDGVWLPLGNDSRDTRWVGPLVRLKPGVSRQAAEQELHALHTRLAAEYPKEFPKDGFTSDLLNYLDITVASGEMEHTLKLLFGAVAFLLLIACANVANLQLARASARVREMAIRLSIGARRSRILRQLLTESLLLSVMGGVLGLLVAGGLIRLMVALMPDYYVPNESRVELNGYALLFCAGVSMLTGIVFGLAPAIGSSRSDLTEALKDAGKDAGSGGQGGVIRQILVVSEVALAVVLLVSAGLTLRSFLAQQQVTLGFNPEHVTRLDVPLPAKRYATAEGRNHFARDLLTRIKAIPGVEAATIGNFISPLGGADSKYSIDGTAPEESRRMLVHLGSADYLRTLGIALLRGEMLAPHQVEDGAAVAVINEAAAALWPPEQNPIGSRLRLDVLERSDRENVFRREGLEPYVTVIGVVGNTKNDGLRNKPRPEVIMPYTLLVPPTRTLAIRSRGDSGLLLAAIRRQVGEMDREQPLGRPESLEEELGYQTLQPRFSVALFVTFAAVGLTLSLSGIYSLLSYWVARRTREMGVRMALGARRADVMRLVMGGGGKLLGWGLLVGIPASLAAARLLQSELFEVNSSDPLSLAGVVVLLCLAGAAACYIPARRAASIQPMAALRQD